MIRPLRFNPDGTIDVWHDERQHGGTVDIDSSVSFIGAQDYIALPCPVVGCGSVSTHPISGGGAPKVVQELFIRKIRRASDVIPGLANRPAGVQGRRNFKAVKDYVKQRAEALDGPGRFKHDNLRDVDVID